MTETVWQRDKRIRKSDLSMAQTFYLCTLNQFVGNNPDAWPSQETIANAMNAKDRSVRNWQTELEAIGVLVVEVGKGRSATNRYRLNLDALPQKQEPRSALNEEPRSGFSPDSAKKRGTTFRPNEEPRSGEKRNHVPTERTVKEHKKEQGFSFPEKLSSKEFSEAWDSWTKYRREIKKKLTASTITKQLKLLETFGTSKAVQSIERSITNGWQGLFDPDQRNGKAIPAASSEAVAAWQVIDNAAHEHRFDEPQFLETIGKRSAEVLKRVRMTAKRINEAGDFDKREMQKQFSQEFTRQGAAQ